MVKNEEEDEIGDKIKQNTKEEVKSTENKESKNKEEDEIGSRIKQNSKEEVIK